MRATLQNQIGIKDSKELAEQTFSLDDAVEKIKVDQQIYMIAPTLKELDLGRQIQMNCFDFVNNKKLPKYTLHVVDSQEAKLLEKRISACFITPQGREKESVFATEMGRQQLCS